MKSRLHLNDLVHSAECLLWHATAQETQSDIRVDWNIANGAGVSSWLPIEVAPDEPFKNAWQRAQVDEDRIDQIELIKSVVRNGQHWLAREFRCVTLDGELHWISECIQVRRSDNLFNLTGVCTDISRLKEVQGDLLHQAFHDPLSGLPNRALFVDRLKRAHSRMRRNGLPVAVIFLDLDNFKVINDSLGHSAGDELLKSIAQLLQRCVRAEDIVARLGGDEFTVLLEDLNSLTDAVLVAERILSELEVPIVMHLREVFVSASIGIALNLCDYDQPELLLRDADAAMYQAKGSGKSQYVIFNDGMTNKAMEKLELQTDLHYAVEKHQLELYFQPIITLGTNTFNEVEALVRWHHPSRGILLPNEFIGIAEETGLIVGLGRWVLREACKKARQWQVLFPDRKPLTMSVNLSGRQIEHAGLAAEISQILSETGFDPDLLKLEVTESYLMQDSGQAIKVLRELKSLGVHLAIDDFGTGYSSMSCLSDFPIDTLKIDRAFIQRLGQAPEDSDIIQAVMMIAQALKLNVTSEGIETPEQLSQLLTVGCDKGQGYLFSEPQTDTEIVHLLQEMAAVEKSADDKPVSAPV